MPFRNAVRKLLGQPATRARRRATRSSVTSGIERLEQRTLLTSVFGDFNGDGFDDLAIGVPGEYVGPIPDAGAVNVIYGSANGLIDTGNDIWYQDQDGVQGDSEAGDRFGEALAAGDFNNDGFFDLAIGIPGEDVNGADKAGAVAVLYGTADGLVSGAVGSVSDDQYLHQGLTGVADLAERFDRFGSALTTGDFNGDGITDLAIGIPGENGGPVQDAGAVQIMFGSTDLTGLKTDGGQYLKQGGGFISSNPVERYDMFGAALAAGDMNGDGIDDLAIGVPGEDLPGGDDMGAVHVLMAALNVGLERELDFFHQDSVSAFDGSHVAGDGRPYDYFGASLAVGDLNNDGFADLAVGVPGEDVGSRIDAGAVNVFVSTLSLPPLSSTIPLGDVSQIWYQSIPNMQDGSKDGDLFGTALAIGDFDGDGDRDLAVGVPGKQVGSQINAGGVLIIESSGTSGLVVAGNRFITQADSWVDGMYETGDAFGSSLAAGFADAGAQADLAVAVPGEDIGSTLVDAGAVNVLYGSMSSNTFRTDKPEIWSQSLWPIEGMAESGDRFGGKLPIGLRTTGFQVPQYESNPGATNTLYLDFDGYRERVQGFPDWIVAPAFDLDGNPKFLSITEMAFIEDIYQAMAEDYAPFDVNVTTISPGGDPARSQRVVFGGRREDNNLTNSTTAYGVGRLGAFTNPLFPNTAYVFTQSYFDDKNPPYVNDLNLRNGVDIGSVGSHEAGHTFGLVHKAEYDVLTGAKFVEYSSGGFDWNPIMGDAIDDGRTIWTAASMISPFSSSRRIEGSDDVGVLSQVLGTRGDDHGDVPSQATNVGTLSKPGDVAFGTGIIENRSDVDTFVVTVQTGAIMSVDYRANGVGANLDSTLVIGSVETGEILATQNWSNTRFRMFERITVTEGTYFISVRSAGAFQGDAGQYSVLITHEGYPDLIISQPRDEFFLETPATTSYRGNFQWEVGVSMDAYRDGNDGSADMIAVSRNGANVEVHINGQRHFSDNAANVTALYIDGSSDDDEVVIEDGVDIPVHFRGGSGGDDAFTISGSTSYTDDLVIEATSVELNGTPFSFEDIERLQVNLQNGGSTTTINAFPDLSESGHLEAVGGYYGTDVFHINDAIQDPVGTVTLNGGAFGTAELHAANRDNIWSITRVGTGTLNGNISFLGIGNLIGNEQNDTFDFGRSGYVYGTIDGGGGNDELTIAGRDSVVDNVVVNANHVLMNSHGYSFDNIETLHIELHGGDSTTTIDAFPDADAFILKGGSGVDRFTINATEDPQQNVRIDGFQGLDTLTAANRDNTWSIASQENSHSFTGYDVGTLNANIEFNGIDNLVGNDGDDTYAFVAAGNSFVGILGAIDGGGGHDVLDYSDDNRTAHVTLLTPTTLTTDRVAGGVANVEGVVGSTYNDTLVGPDINMYWSIHNTDTFYLSLPHVKFRVYGFENLIGGSAYDHFRFSPKRTISGSINGGGGDDLVSIHSFSTDALDQLVVNADSVVLNGRANSFEDIERLQINLYDGDSTSTIEAFPNVDEFIVNGGAQNDSFVVNATNDPMGTVSFNGFAGQNVLTAANRDNTWAITGEGSGDLNSTIAFVGTNSLVGNAAGDTFAFSEGASLDGTIDGSGGTDSLNYSDDNRAVRVELLSPTSLSATGVLGTVFNMEGVVGGSSSTDTLVGPDDVSLFHWLITGHNSGYVADWKEYSPFTFRGFENLTGGEAQDLFRFYGTASIDGSIDGGASLKDWLRYRKYGTGVHVDLMSGTATGVGGSIANIERIIGTVYDDFLRGDDNNNFIHGYHDGNDIILGMGGNDLLYASYYGRNLIVGGGGADFIQSRYGEDLIIGGFTVYDTHPHVDVILVGIRDAWARTDQTFEQRVDTLRNGISLTLPGEDGPSSAETVALNNETVLDDSDDDQIHDQSGLDWFFASLAEVSDFDEQNGILN